MDVGQVLDVSQENEKFVHFQIKTSEWIHLLGKKAKLVMAPVNTEINSQLQNYTVC